MTNDLRDMGTIIWKEWREVAAGGGRRNGGLRLALLVGVVAIVLPLQARGNWTTSPLPIFFDDFYLPLAVLTALAANTFAGERERHTLETLLASRLTERAIVLGKIAALALLGWVLALFAALLQLAVVAVTNGGTFHMYTTGALIGIGVGSLLMATLIASIGSIVSEHAASVQNAQQTLTVGFLLVVAVPIALLLVLSPAQRLTLLSWFANVSPTALLLGMGAVILALDVVFIAIALVRFRRTTIFGVD